MRKLKRDLLQTGSYLIKRYKLLLLISRVYRLYVCSFTHKPVLDHLGGLQYSVIWVPDHLRLLLAILNIRQTMVSHAVGRGHIYASCFVTQVAFGTPFLSVIIAKL